MNDRNIDSLVGQILIFIPIVFFFTSIINFLLGREVTPLTLLLSSVGGVFGGIISHRIIRRSEKRREARKPRTGI